MSRNNINLPNIMFASTVAYRRLVPFMYLSFQLIIYAHFFFKGMDVIVASCIFAYINRIKINKIEGDIATQDENYVQDITRKMKN